MLDNLFALYPGSFLPFHKGHDYIYQKSLDIFKCVIIVKAKNPNKNFFSINNSKIPYDNTIEWNSLLPELCEILKIYNIVRGFRTPIDYLYEKQLCITYRILNPKINFILLPTSEENININSSKLRG